MKAKSQTTADFNDLLQDARILADFSNVNTPEEADNFHHNYRDFFPESWWGEVQGLIIDKATGDQVGRTRAIWENEQQKLRAAWTEGFPLEKSIALITSVEKATQLAQTVNEFAQRMSGTNDLPALAKQFVWPKAEVFPCQRAVMFLATHSWRARHCSMCGNRFVKAYPKQTACGENCRKDQETRRKKTWWSKSGSEQRRSKQKRKLGKAVR